MTRVLIISAEPRLVSAIADVVDRGDTEVESVDTWEEGFDILLKERFDLVCLDYDALKLEALDTFITLDNIFQKEGTEGVLLVREMSQRASDFEKQLTSIRHSIELRKGRERFERILGEIFAEVARRRDDESNVETTSDDADYVTVEVDLPRLERGAIHDVGLGRLVYNLRTRKESGVLRLDANGIEIKFAFAQGDIAESSGFDHPEELRQAFGWANGDYEFDRKNLATTKSRDPLSIIGVGIREQMQQRAVMDQLMPHMQTFPSPTHLWDERRGIFENFGALYALMRVCDGTMNWEEVLSNLGSMANAGFRAGLLATVTDMVHNQETPGVAGVTVRYSRDVRRAREKVDESARQKTKAFRATGSGKTELAAELKQFAEKMEEMTPHEIFGVWEGCGRQVVQERFYKLVKEHHPDVYGGNVSAEVREIAQEIFINVKTTYQELLGTEKEQTVPPPDTPIEPPGIGGISSEAATPGFDRGKETTDARRNRPIHETPVARSTKKPTARTNGSAGTGERESSKPKSSPRRSSEKDRDTSSVRDRIESLSGFRRKKQKVTPAGLEQMSEVSDAEVIVDEVKKKKQKKNKKKETAEAESEAEATDKDRKKKLDALLKRASKVDSPNAPNPARDAFNKGYRAFKNEEMDKAWRHIERAHELEPNDGLYLTFYAQLLRKREPHRRDEAKALLEKAIDTGNRQAMPDACLYMGHILKEEGNEKRAMRFYRRALKLNPNCREAERELRLDEMRGGEEKRKKSDPGTFLKKLFKK